MSLSQPNIIVQIVNRMDLQHVFSRRGQKLSDINSCILQISKAKSLLNSVNSGIGKTISCKNFNGS